MSGEEAELDIESAIALSGLYDDENEPEDRECFWCGDDANVCGCEVMYE